MKEVLIKREIKNILNIFQQNNYTLEERKLFISFKIKIAEYENNEVLIEACRQIEINNYNI